MQGYICVMLYICLRLYLWLNEAQSEMFSCVRQPNMVGARKTIVGRIGRKHWHQMVSTIVSELIKIILLILCLEIR